ncbi:hypothetical protein CQ011_03630 [Arthrobacter sp. MYb213]|nr:hypothetical protein CQ011_03630 [Arthrobacter sp. MYb213]
MKKDLERLGGLTSHVYSEIQELKSSIVSHRSSISEGVESAVSLNRKYLEESFVNELNKTQQRQYIIENKITYELGYLSKSFSDSLEESNRNVKSLIDSSDTLNRLALEKLARDVSGIQSKIGPVSVSAPLRSETSANTLTSNVRSLFGRGAASVQEDPERTRKIYNRLAGKPVLTPFVIGSPEIKAFIFENLGKKPVSLHPSLGTHVINNILTDDETCSIPILIIEASVLESGLWASSLSSSGTRIYQALSDLITFTREKQGFSFLVGSVHSANTFSTSLQNRVDSCITTSDFEEDWAVDADLTLPRNLQMFLKEQVK